MEQRNQLLCARELVKSFGTGEEKRKVLDGVTVEIENGDFVSVMGPSGSGKSTLLYALSGMDGIDSGTVTFAQQNLSALSDNELSDLRRKKMGFVFQQPTLLKNLNILDNIILPLMRDHRQERKKLMQRARMLMKQVGIEELADRDITQVSGGQLQRAGICRALMCEPQIIFGDEPTGALNSKAAREVMELFSQINAGGTTVLLVTHDVNVAARTKRVLFMQDGKIVSHLDFPQCAQSEGAEYAQRVEQITLQMRAMGI